MQHYPASLLHDPFCEFLEVTALTDPFSPPAEGAVLTVKDDFVGANPVSVSVTIPDSNRRVGTCTLVVDGNNLRVQSLYLYLHNCLGKLIAAAVGAVSTKYSRVVVRKESVLGTNASLYFEEGSNPKFYEANHLCGLEGA